MQQTEQLKMFRALLDRREAGAYLNCGPKRIDDLRKSGTLRAHLDGRAWRYTRADLDAYIDSLPTSA